MSNQFGAMQILRTMRDGARRPAMACPPVAVIFLAAIITLTTPAPAAESRTTRVPSGMVRSEQLTHELWLHAQVQRFPIFCDTTRTLTGQVTRRASHEFQAFATVGPDPSGPRARVEHLRLRYSIRDVTAGTEDCHDADWCPARHQGDCRRSCATAEAWDHGRHAVTSPACLEPR